MNYIADVIILDDYVSVYVSDITQHAKVQTDRPSGGVPVNA